MCRLTALIGSPCILDRRQAQLTGHTQGYTGSRIRSAGCEFAPRAACAAARSLALPSLSSTSLLRLDLAQEARLAACKRPHQPLHDRGGGAGMPRVALLNKLDAPGPNCVVLFEDCRGAAVVVELSAKKGGALEELRASPTTRQRVSRRSSRALSGVLAQAVFVLLEQGGQYLGMWQRGVRGCIDKYEVANVWGLSGSELEVEGLQRRSSRSSTRSRGCGVHAAPMTAGILAFSNMLLLVAMRAAHGVKHATGTRAGNLEPNAAEAGLCAVRNVLDVMIDRVQQHICGLHAGGPARRAQDAQSLLGCKECPPSLYRSGTSTPPRTYSASSSPGNTTIFASYFTRHCARHRVCHSQALLFSVPVAAWLLVLQRPAMFAQMAIRCVSLPAYPFAGTKFWVPFVTNAPASILVEDETGVLPFVKRDVRRQLGGARDEAMPVGELKYLPTVNISTKFIQD
ncbi:hypothetical protein FB451DRAFT_1369934, partial [Mycena latifolia]